MQCGEYTMPEYDQRTGEIFYAGTLIGRGYSGTGTDRNRPESEHIRDRGPIPRGTYTIEYVGDYPGRGPMVFRLTPTQGTDTHGRSGFLIHGDNEYNDASTGCIVMPPNVRRLLMNTADNTLTVR
jgi:hypothetical protein